ncbi:MAG: hypothetical protein HY721_18140 [Planctomycetes bacterium]|nr:hypothetical protein [Planctomycetota bacterium]
MRSGAEKAILDLPVGAAPEPLALAANMPEPALADGLVETTSPAFVYAFLPAEKDGLESVSVLNEATGLWCSRALPAEGGPRLDAPEHAGMDTDSDGVLDVDEALEEPPRVDFVGIQLAPGPNRLKVVSRDRRGRSRLETLTVTLVAP